VYDSQKRVDARTAALVVVETSLRNSS